ncbi:FAD-linked oxidase [Vulcanimicrobium alpinum]|uniref:FAD-linked oxidase n=1 Tax=Vulcanimicrobium alpinum TaxID=3016050 RepID=A0AAN1XWL9_UNVUL|nr:FAD-binding oxidoreductase [Vulcanimicrobium alpinum]BDE05663.1 FAD-linked oxidase [Vulcanimicrobium alpinum]
MIAGSPKSAPRVVEPADAGELAAALRAAADAGEAVLVRGGGTLLAAANPPRRCDAVIATTRLCAVHSYDPRDLTIGAGAGMTLAALAETLAQHGQFLPLDAPFPARATIGGTLAAGWTGPRRSAYGRARDLLIGSTVALADGTLAASGGMVVKNVTGYDMGKLYVGSHGTLGAFVRANFKVLPMPPARRFAVSRFDPGSRERLDAGLHALMVPPVALLIRDGFAALLDGDARGDHRPEIVALFEGSESSVERGVRDYRSTLGAAGVAETRILDGADAAAVFQRAIDSVVAPADGQEVTLLARGLPSEAVHRAEAARTALGANVPVRTLADLLTGDVVAGIAGDAGALARGVARLRDVLGRAQIVASHLPAGVEIDAWGTAPSTIGTMRALKARFDPHGTLAPGGFVGGI